MRATPTSRRRWPSRAPRMRATNTDAPWCVPVEEACRRPRRMPHPGARTSPSQRPMVVAADTQRATREHTAAVRKDPALDRGNVAPATARGGAAADGHRAGQLPAHAEAAGGSPEPGSTAVVAPIRAPGYWNLGRDAPCGNDCPRPGVGARAHCQIETTYPSLDAMPVAVLIKAAELCQIAQKTACVSCLGADPAAAGRVSERRSAQHEPARAATVALVLCEPERLRGTSASWFSSSHWRSKGT